MPFGTASNPFGLPTDPGLDPDIFAQKQTGGNDLAKSIEDIIKGGTPYVLGLERKENEGNAKAEDIIRSALGRSAGPAVSQQDIDNAVGQGADEAGKQYLQNIGNLSDTLGGAGITGGGLPAALYQQYQLARVGQIGDTRRAAYLDAAKQNTLKKQMDFQNTMAFANQTAQGPSMIGADWLNNILGLRLEQNATNRADEAAKRAAKASKNAGWMGLGGDVLKGALGLFGA